MTEPDRECLYLGLLGKIAFNADMKAAGHSDAETDALWLARFPNPEPPSNVIYGVDFAGKEKPGPEAA